MRVVYLRRYIARGDGRWLRRWLPSLVNNKAKQQWEVILRHGQKDITLSKMVAKLDFQRFSCLHPLQ